MGGIEGHNGKDGTAGGGGGGGSEGGCKGGASVDALCRLLSMAGKQARIAVDFLKLSIARSQRTGLTLVEAMPRLERTSRLLFIMTPVWPTTKQCK